MYIYIYVYKHVYIVVAADPILLELRADLLSLFPDQGLCTDDARYKVSQCFSAAARKDDPPRLGDTDQS